MPTCEFIRGRAQAYWNAPAADRAIDFAWVHSHCETCDPCSVYLEDVAEKMNIRPPGAETESC
jgi:hypothetical protein